MLLNQLNLANDILNGPGTG